MAVMREISGKELEQGYHKLLERVGAAAERSGRKPADVVMVAVTKTATPDRIRTLVEMGHSDFGESRVQQLIQRAAQLDEFLGRQRSMGAARSSVSGAPESVRWHMIGHLQRNKVKRLIPLTRLIHSVDSLRVAEEIHMNASRMDEVVDILLQVNVSKEATKQGVAPPAVLHFAEQIETMVHLRLRGLMTMAPRSENPEDARPVFGRAKELFEELKASGLGGEDCNLLSMGMSDDFEVAIEEGANIVRVGRALFGEGDPDQA